MKRNAHPFSVVKLIGCFIDLLGYACEVIWKVDFQNETQSCSVSIFLAFFGCNLTLVSDIREWKYLVDEWVNSTKHISQGKSLFFISFSSVQIYFEISFWDESIIT